jgi:hypothetical protein
MQDFLLLLVLFYSLQKLNVVNDCAYWKRQKRGQGTKFQT